MDVSDFYLWDGAPSGSVQSLVFSTRSYDYINGFDYDPTFSTTDSSVIVLHILSSFLCAPDEPCLDATNNPRFMYRIASYSWPLGPYISVPGVGSFNPFTPSMTFTVPLVYPIGVGKVKYIMVELDETEFSYTPALGVLVIAPDNKAGKNQALELSLSMTLS